VVSKLNTETYLRRPPLSLTTKRRREKEKGEKGGKGVALFHAFG